MSAANVHYNPPRTTTGPIGVAGAASTISAALESTDLLEAQSHAVITASDQEREIRDIDWEMAGDGSTDDSNADDYSARSDAAGSQIRPTTFSETAKTDEGHGIQRCKSALCSLPRCLILNYCSHLVCQYAGERRDSHPWILNTKDYWIKSRMLSHIFLRIITRTWYNIAEISHC